MEKGIAPPTSKKFRELAKSRGVDLLAEQERARTQLEYSIKVGGTTEATREQQKQKKGVEKNE